MFTHEELKMNTLPGDRTLNTLNIVAFFATQITLISHLLSLMADFEDFSLADVPDLWLLSTLLISSVLFLISSLISSRFRRVKLLTSLIASILGLVFYGYALYAFLVLSFIFFLLYPPYWVTFIFQTCLLLYLLFRNMNAIRTTPTGN